ncbi:probable glutamate receptor [Ornithodoros turicata]|uniref:probable glutamate receptor n=1 Tax=Ornithodoros turicata TaxID=34597 RepID=UPI003138C40C
MISNETSFRAGYDGSTTRGVIGDVQARVIDILLMNVFPTSNLRNHVAFSRPYRYDALTFYPPFPVRISHFSRLILPFEPVAWLWIGVAVICVAVVSIRAGCRRSFSAALLGTIGVVLHESFIHKVEHLSARLAIAGWLLASVVISASYTACITSYHNSPPTHYAIDDLDRLANALTDGKIAVCINNMSVYHSILHQPSSYILRAIRRSVYSKQITNIGSRRECIQRVRHGSHALLSTDYHMSWAVAPHGEILVRSRDNLYTVPYGWTMPKGSPYIRAVDKIMSQMFEGGIFRYLGVMDQLRYWNVSVPRMKRRRSRPKMIRTSDISATGCIHLVGCALATLTLFLEALVEFLRVTLQMRGH